MKWGLLFLIVVNLYALCCGNRFDDFLHEKQEFLEKVDKLFDTLYFRDPPHELSDSPATEVLNPRPLSSPEWPSTSSSSEEADEAIELPEHENYRPPEEGGARHRASEDSDDGSGSGAGADGDQESSEYFVEATSEPTGSESVDAQCSSHLKAEVRSCVELSLNVRRMVTEMEQLVARTGYYNVSPDSDYLTQMFRVCMSSILTPPGCYRDDGDAGVIEKATVYITAFVHSKEGLSVGAHEAKNFNCFATHLFFLKTCLGDSLTNAQLEGLVRTVMLRDRESVCQGFLKVQQCFTSSLGRCEDSTSAVHVEEMFEVTLRKVTSCWVKTHSHSMTTTPLGAIVLFSISILTSRFL